MTATATNTGIVLHGKTRWSDILSNYSFRDGIEFTVTLPGKQPLTHREHSRCLTRYTGDVPQAESIRSTKATFAKQVKLEEAGEDRTAWFCTRCLIHLDKALLAPEQIAAREAKAKAEAAAKPVSSDEWNTAPAPVAKPKAPSKPAGSKITRPTRSTGRKTAAKGRKA